LKIAVFPLVSSLHQGAQINEQTQALLTEIKQYGDYESVLSPISTLYDADLSLILIQSGGSEGFFLEMKEHFQAPYYLLTYGSNNSLAASMEILSYLKSNNANAEILHGTAQYIANRLQSLAQIKTAKPDNLGIIGKPSDWLIASHVDKKQCLDALNVNLIDIEMKELLDLYEHADPGSFTHTELLCFDQHELDQAKKVSVCLEKIVDKYQLKGLTIRCFDLLSSIHTTGCLGLSMLNNDHIVGSCEGDVPAMLSMYLLNKLTHQCGFQANPSRVDVEQSQIVLAHCTIPTAMTESYTITTHFESGIGVAIKGALAATDVTIFKLNNDLKHYYVEEGKIIQNLDETNLCRTQILVQLPDVKYFLTSPYGNHHIVVYGKHKKTIQEYCDNHL